jgi:type I restriction enzyme R subunit
MPLHTEINFELELCGALAATGWLYEEGDAARYDVTRALFLPDLIAWLEATQPVAWSALVKLHGDKAAEVLAKRVREQLDARGTLDVLRSGVDMLGLKARLACAQFRPAFALNADLVRRYEANRLRVVRQVHYSAHTGGILDLVLFLNGIPVATAELKTDFTQSVHHAIEQYKEDRVPQLKGKSPEPLLSFPGGALVHFAVSNREVYLTTRLAGPATRFLPFNRGNHGAAGNPEDPAGGHPTAYLWREVWARDSWLEILGRYLVPERNDKKQVVDIVFPRYHQLDVTRKLVADVAARGAGGRYLIQHSAGSGKTKSIAWTAHFLSELHDAGQQKVFDTVLVVSDRNVIDGQLQDALFAFERKTGVVEKITKEDGSKSKQLAAALNRGKKIVVCTMQTFPYALDEVRTFAATEGKRFAVIADEAHSSQSGEAAATLKAVLSAAELAELEDGGEISGEDLLAAQMAARASDTGITFVAFTATPKAKTVELFGTRPDSSRPPADDNRPTAFHVYSMRQAIEEGFILDVLQNYTSYKVAFKVGEAAGAPSGELVERSAAMRGIMGWVKLHPYNIGEKVKIVVEHFRQFVAPLLDGRAKAMVVVGSRKEAVRWKLAIERYITEKGYGIGTLVAFSGEVVDPEIGPDPFTEGSTALNPTLKGRDIRKAFDEATYQILLVANKFQTGFDQPLLCGMYIDKRLAGIQAVQTLSRLNRAHPGKDTTYVVDFMDQADEVLAAFRTYYETAALATTTDPHLVYSLRAKLDATGYYDDFEVERVVAVELNPKAKQSDLVAAVFPVAQRLITSYQQARNELRRATAARDSHALKEAKGAIDVLELFKKDLGEYVRLYIYLSQIFDFGNTDVEKRAIFFRHLGRALDFAREREGIDLSGLRLTHHQVRERGPQYLMLGGTSAPGLTPITAVGTGTAQERQKALLAEIIERLNDLFDGELTEGDKLVYANDVIMGKLLESEKLRQQAASNSKEQFGNSPHLKAALQDAIIEALEAHTAMSTQVLNDQRKQDELRRILLEAAGLYEALRGQAGVPHAG